LSEGTRALIILVLVMILLLTIAFLGSTFLMKRALRQVIKKFREGQALSSQAAKTEDELGLKARGAFEFKGLRDYRPIALQFLIRQEIVGVTEEGKLFLLEENLSKAGLKI
jgi:hypothetical protein